MAFAQGVGQQCIRILERQTEDVSESQKEWWKNESTVLMSAVASWCYMNETEVK